MKMSGTTLLLILCILNLGVVTWGDRIRSPLPKRHLLGGGEIVQPLSKEDFLHGIARRYKEGTPADRRQLLSHDGDQQFVPVAKEAANRAWEDQDVYGKRRLLMLDDMTTDSTTDNDNGGGAGIDSPPPRRGDEGRASHDDRDMLGAAVPMGVTTPSEGRGVMTEMNFRDYGRRLLARGAASPTKAHP